MIQLVLRISILIIVVWHSQWTPIQPSYLPCRSEIDSLTKQLVYVVADIEPWNEGGNNKLTREFERKIRTSKIILDPKNHDANIIVAFIVDKHGAIKGERVVSDRTLIVGQQMLDIIKSFKWTPAKCNGQIVSMIQKRTMIIDIAKE